MQAKKTDISIIHIVKIYLVFNYMNALKSDTVILSSAFLFKLEVFWFFKYYLLRNLVFLLFYRLGLYWMYKGNQKCSVGIWIDTSKRHTLMKMIAVASKIVTVAIEDLLPTWWKTMNSIVIELLRTGSKQSIQCGFHIVKGSELSPSKVVIQWM
jgi:hypothetical protein